MLISVEHEKSLVYLLGKTGKCPDMTEKLLAGM